MKNSSGIMQAQKIGHVLDDVDVGEHGGLAVQLVVDVGLRRVEPVPAWGCRRCAAEHALEARRPGR